MRKTATETLRDRVRELMLRRGWTQLALALKSGVSQSRIAYLLNYHDQNDRHPTTKVIEQLAAAFGVSAWQMLRPDDVNDSGVAEPEPLDVELLATVLAEANDLWRARHLVPTFDELAAFAARMYYEVQTGIPLRRAATKVGQQLEQIRSGTFLAAPSESSGGSLRHGQEHQGKGGRSKARTR